MPQSHDPTEPGELIRFGTVDSVDLDAGKCTVKAGDVVSGPIRWCAGRAGATRIWSPPTVGEQVALFCPDGELGSAIAFPGISSAAHPPAGNSLRELIGFGDGAIIAYDPEAHLLEAVLPGGATVSIVASGGVTIDAPVHVTGDITCDGDVVAGGISLRHHKHDQVKAGSDQTGEPA